MSDLPPNVYRVAQRAFDAIPGGPWVYWIPDGLRRLFETLPKLGDVAQPRQGLATADNFRFLRYWWEMGRGRIGFGCRDRAEALATGKRWFPIIKGSRTLDWAGTEYEVVNWQNDGEELRTFQGAVIRNPDFYFRNGLTLTRVGPSGFSTRINSGGCLLDSSNTASFPQNFDIAVILLGVLNSGFVQTILRAINPTINFQVGDLVNLPVPRVDRTDMAKDVNQIIRFTLFQVSSDETTFDFIAPPRWDTGLADLAAAEARLAALEAQIDDEVYRLYAISDADRAAIEAELAGGAPAAAEDEDAPPTEENEEPAAEPPMTRQELAVRWISYAVGVVLGRFSPGARGALGSAVYRREDFAVGSLPAPDEDEFDQLVGPLELRLRGR